MSELGVCVGELGRFPEAESLLTGAYAGLENGRCSDRSEASMSIRRERVIQRAVRLYELWDTAEPGRGYDLKAAEWRTKSGESTGG
jgi:hypothetical protein